jgi:DNA-binding LacI/PurR family transcriptional regulator
MHAEYAGTRDRIAGYFEPIAQAGIDPATVPIYETLNDEATTHAGLAHFFASETPPTAILCMSDKVALIALKWLAAHGLAVPGDVSVVGFDGVPEGEDSKPPLTTIAQPMAEMGRRAVEMILGVDGKVHREMLAIDLVVRGSTSAPRS